MTRVTRNREHGAEWSRPTFCEIRWTRTTTWLLLCQSRDIVASIFCPGLACLERNPDMAQPLAKASKSTMKMTLDS